MSQTLTAAPAPAPARSIASAFQEHQRDCRALPAWWRERQQAALGAFAAAPYPKRKDEHWRFSSVQGLAVEGYDLLATADAERARELAARSTLLPQAAAVMVFADHTLGARSPLPDDLANRGVVFATLTEALEQHGDLVRQHLAPASSPLGSDKFAALHHAFTRAGAVVIVPEGVVVEQPLCIYHWAATDRAALFPHTLIIAGKASQVRVVDVFFTDGEARAHLAISQAHIVAGEGSRVSYKVFQNWSEQALAFHLVSLAAHRDAYVKNLSVNLGGRQYRSETQSLLEGQGSRVETYSLSVAEADQEIDQRTLQVHKAPGASSDLLFKNALFDRSRTIFSGLIKVAEGAQKTDAYQSNRNLLLSGDAEANSLPGLEIGANDVRCTHGATTAEIDKEELFYLQARGIPEDRAKELLVFGFFEEVVAKIENEALRELFRSFIQMKFQRHR